MKVGVLAGSFLAAVIGGTILAICNRHYRPAHNDDENVAVAEPLA
ncbi:hypothetical protein [Rathayibacter sp. VKM Ac-2759]|nr:hypothetical protein [Rathayibacter sp. VKM Ac-2759]